MPDVKVKPIKLKMDRERNLIMDLNALEIIEDIYEDLDSAFKAFQEDKKKIKHVKNFIYAGLVHEDESLTPEKVGKLIAYQNLDEITDIIWCALAAATPDANEDEKTSVGEQ